MNETGHASGNAEMVAGRTLPWLQDDNTPNAWGLWHAMFRDVVILDAEGFEVARYNLTVNDLAEPANYLQLKNLLQRVAGE